MWFELIPVHSKAKKWTFLSDKINGSRGLGGSGFGGVRPHGEEIFLNFSPLLAERIRYWVISCVCSDIKSIGQNTPPFMNMSRQVDPLSDGLWLEVFEAGIVLSKNLKPQILLFLY